MFKTFVFLLSGHASYSLYVYGVVVLARCVLSLSVCPAKHTLRLHLTYLCNLARY